MEDQPKIKRPNYTLQYTLGNHENAISSVKFSPFGHSIASCSYDSYIKLWDVHTGCLENELHGHKKGISEIDWSDDGKLLVSASDDTKLKIWNVGEGKCVRTLKGHEDNVFCTRFSRAHGSNYILSGSDDFSVRLWDVETGICLKKIEAHKDRVSGVDFDYCSSVVLTSSYDGFFYVYDLRTGEILQDHFFDTGISFAKFSPNSKYILLATFDNTIKLWDLAKKKVVRTYTGHKNEKFSIFGNFSVTDENINNKWIVSGSEDYNIYIWHLQSAVETEVLKGHSACVICVDCHPQKNIIVSGALDPDNSIKIWKSSQ